MIGQAILARSMGEDLRRVGQRGASSEYASAVRLRRLACWTLLFDLLCRCKALRIAAEDRRIGYKFDHALKGPVETRLDLVVTGVPRWSCGPPGSRWFADLVNPLGIELTELELAESSRLPIIAADPFGAASQVLIALQVKLCMASHAQSLVRLHGQIVATGALAKRPPSDCISAAYVIVNGALAGARFIVEALAADVPVAARLEERAHDAIGVTVVRRHDDGAAVELSPDWHATPSIDAPTRYECMLDRMSSLFSERFGRAEAPWELRADRTCGHKALIVRAVR